MAYAKVNSRVDIFIITFTIAYVNVGWQGILFLFDVTNCEGNTTETLLQVQKLLY